MTLDFSDCPPHDLGYHYKTKMRRCKKCGSFAQDITSHPRAACVGDFRVVCEGVDGDGVCPIGPSLPTCMIGRAKDYLEEHQEEAKELDGCLHKAKIIQL